MKATHSLVAGAAIALLPLTALAQSPSPDSPSQPPASAPSQQGGATFESLDIDSDGRISRMEAEANANVKAQFSRYDVNGDGFIERAEVTQSNESRSTPQQ